MNAFSVTSLDDALVRLAVLLSDQGQEAQPRGLSTLEVANVGFTLSDPRARLIWNPVRRWNPFLAIGELIWHLSGSRRAATISHYAPGWSEFATASVIPGSSYGYKIFRRTRGSPSQWDQLKALLTSDPSSRRAVVSLYSGSVEMSHDARDVACAVSMQFLVRNGRLHASVMMRSNDLIWGLCYDCFVFTMLQEMLARELGYEVGEYSHFATSLHVYDRHFGLLRSIASDQSSFDVKPMPPMPGPAPVSDLVAWETKIRNGTGDTITTGLPEYWRQLMLLLALHRSRLSGSVDSERRILSELSGTLYERLVRNDRRGARPASSVRL